MELPPAHRHTTRPFQDNNTSVQPSTALLRALISAGVLVRQLQRKDAQRLLSRGIVAASSGQLNTQRVSSITRGKSRRLDGSTRLYACLTNLEMRRDAWVRA
eukprot:3985016-Pleurochrysis_carterae.AAC.1